MSDREIPGPNESDTTKRPLTQREDADVLTHSIDLIEPSLLEELTDSGSFDLRAIKRTALGKLLRALPIPAFFIDKYHKIVFVNSALGKVSPTYKEVMDRDFADLFPDPIEGKGATEALREVFFSRKPAIFEGRIEVGRSGMWGRAHLRSVRVKEQQLIIVLVEDLTLEKAQLLLEKKHQEELQKANEQLNREIVQRTRAEEAREESWAKYRAIVEAYDGMIFICSEDYEIEFANQRLIDRTGYNPVGMKCYETIHDQDNICSWCTMEKSLRGETVRGEVLSPRDNRWYYIVNSPIRHPDGSLSKISVIQDITDIKKAEETLLQTARIKAVGDMAGGVAHNFNNLLQVLMGRAQMALAHLELRNLSETKKNVDQILQSSRLGAETVRRLQDFSRVQVDEELVEGKVFDISDAVSEAIEVSKPWWRTRPEKEGISVTVRRKLESGCLVKGKENEVFEVVINLMKNAAEALPGGGEIRVRTRVAQAEVLLQIQDNGIGIPKENLGKLFEPFWTTKGVDGTGMGLATCYAIVKRHQGKISVHSEQGKGATFTVRLPLAEKSREISPPESEQELGSKLRILVIDDMEAVVTILKEGLTQYGQTIFTAQSGKEGMQLYQETEVDVVISDLGMPEMNGWEVGKRIRTICLARGKPKTPFILLTGWGGQIAEKDKIVESGVDAVVDKPVVIAKLLEAIRNVTRETKTPGENSSGEVTLRT
ncbi:MAG: ATP-binding protein [Deltaproteobacteria bacterium]